MNSSPFHVITNVQTHMVVERSTGRCLGAFGSNFYRSWVFPLYTPRGLTVVQEYAYDHPFHNGVFVGQYPVVAGERRVNFWAAPLRYADADYHVFQHVGSTRASGQPLVEPHERGVRFTLGSIWCDEHGQPVLDETRTVDIFALDGATVCDVQSRKRAAYGALQFPQTKYGSVGVRVEPRLLPDFGGLVLADDGRVGNAEVVHEQESDYVAYENTLAGDGRYGVLLSILDEMRGPWFIRDYGMAMYNPTWTHAITIDQAESWTVSLRVVAYDGALDTQRARDWVEFRE